ncbi:MAG TPA: diguanylate cyclase [Polyangia bacterium]|jgi:diguanylate cyclase (GGDEF)-like protein|nr:diguanylate cyclase [Polyangia bacterium]
MLNQLIRGARVLIVDDDRIQCEHMARLVSEWQARPFTAQTLAEALRLFRDVHPDVVLLDVMMPHVDGYKMAQMFKRDAAFTPVILLTALDDIDSKQRGLAAGADEFLIKPVNVLELQIRMSSMLRIKRLADELERANKELAALATTDALTKVANRRMLDQRLLEEFERARRYLRPLALLVVDVDHFKSVNDTYGHQVGDRVLTEVACSIQDTIRKSDLVGRFGGEEFVVVAPETPAAPVRSLGERIRLNIQKRTAAAKDAGLPTVTASLGAATTELNVDTVAELLKRADEALYEAKQAGRNRVIVAT